MRVDYQSFAAQISRCQNRESAADDRITFNPVSRMSPEDRERLRTWFREWREHLWRCYDAQ